MKDKQKWGHYYLPSSETEDQCPNGFQIPEQSDVVHVEVGEAQVIVGGDDDDFQLAHMPCANKDEVDNEEANCVTCAKDEGNIEEVDAPHNGGDEDLEDLPYNDGDEHTMMTMVHYTKLEGELTR